MKTIKILVAYGARTEKPILLPIRNEDEIQKAYLHVFSKLRDSLGDDLEWLCHKDSAASTLFTMAKAGNGSAAHALIAYLGGRIREDLHIDFVIYEDVLQLPDERPVVKVEGPQFVDIPSDWNER